MERKDTGMKIISLDGFYLNRNCCSGRGSNVISVLVISKTKMLAFGGNSRLNYLLFLDKLSRSCGSSVFSKINISILGLSTLTRQHMRFNAKYLTR